ncbi:MAG: winged helix-turn-helix domain-containing protein [Methanosarcinaceae archaeon]|nr:winged helix-turn-helix domain-containing protein [Methanosarcinaceae archaeon]
MSRDLLSLLLFSEKRKAFLLLLQAGPVKREESFEQINVPRTTLLPQIKILIEQNLVFRENGTYRLTRIGEIIVEKMKFLVDTLEVFEQNEEFWNGRNLCSIPRPFLTRIHELRDYELMIPDLSYVFELNQKLIAQISTSKQVNIFISYFHPHLPDFFIKLARKGVEINLALNDSVFERIVTDFRKEGEEFLKLENVKLFVLSKKEIKVPALVAASDTVMILGLFDSKGRFDRHYLANSKASALSWGNNLFWHYMNFATRVNLPLS